MLAVSYEIEVKHAVRHMHPCLNKNNERLGYPCTFILIDITLDTVMSHVQCVLASMVGVTGVRRNRPGRQILGECRENGTVKDIAKPVHKA